MPILNFFLYLYLTNLQDLTQISNDEQYSPLFPSLWHIYVLSSFNERSYGILFLKGAFFQIGNETSFYNSVKNSWKQIESFPARKSCI